ncbi:transcription factor SRM1-like [Chenopodium quinoa]|uniref:Uncharacterized protein n=1 Tax=Chenopodium quinoa TaxID=63459 RepID=A0A803LB92_CHEQI|nr:transcription factor SRM1-like [Chenopodium quinoa]
MELPSSSSKYKAWSFEENKLFENCIAMEYVSSDEFDWWTPIANVFFRGTRTPDEIKNHYNQLVFDVNEIENGRFCIPKYKDDKVDNYNNGHDNFIYKKKKIRYTQWSKDEHRLFVIGAMIYGGGDWRSISRMVVKTRSPIQVASHAQKFYDRKKHPKNTKRASIHDITTVDHDTTLDLCQRNLIDLQTFQSYIAKLAEQDQATGEQGRH